MLSTPPRFLEIEYKVHRNRVWIKDHDRTMKVLSREPNYGQYMYFFSFIWIGVTVSLMISST